MRQCIHEKICLSYPILLYMLKTLSTDEIQSEGSLWCLDLGASKEVLLMGKVVGKKVR